MNEETKNALAQAIYEATQHRVSVLEAMNLIAGLEGSGWIIDRDPVDPINHDDKKESAAIEGADAPPDEPVADVLGAETNEQSAPQ